MRLIDIEDMALLKTVSCGGLSAKKLWKRIKEQPTIDAEPVVYCRDCKWLERNYCDEYGDLEPLFCKNWVAGVDEDGYCYEAERREP